MRTMIQRCRRSQALSPISFLLTATILICNCITANAATYQLSYDAILNTTEVHRLQQEQIKELPPAELEKMLMPPFTEGLGGIGGLDFIMDKIQQNVVEFWHSHKNEQEEGRVHDDAKVECLPKGKKARCFLDYDIGSDIVFSIDSSVHQLYGDKAQKGTQDFSEDGAWDVRFDVIVDADSDAAPGLFSRDVLIYILNHVFGSIVTANSPAPVWSIDERPSPLDQNLKLRILEEWQIIPGSRASSLEKIVLTNSNAAARLPLQTYSNAWLANGLEVPPPSIDIWTIEEVGRRPVTSLFLDGVIRATTGDAGIAYAEAFVHPALLSHPDPRRVAVISDMPLPLLKEILKYKSISEVTLVGSHMAAMSSACFHLKELNECYINGETSDCLNDGRVEIAKEGVDEWLNTKLAELHTNEGGSEYDVFLVDVSSPAQNEQFLSSTCSAKIQQLIGDESIIIYNAGVQPSHDTNHDHMSHDWARDDFLEMLTTNDDSGYGPAFIYDELSAAPFETTFIVVFDESEFPESLERFVRPTHTSIDIDIVQRFHKQKELPTRFYDGPTHATYLNPSRVWEAWYCQSYVGKEQNMCKTFLSKFYDPSQHEAKTEVRRDQVKGRGVYALNDIPAGSFINPDDSHLNLHINRYQWEALQQFIKDYPDAHMYRQLRDFYLSYGFENDSSTNGLTGWTVSIASMNTFMNHACEDADQIASGINIHLNSFGQVILFSPVGYRRKFIVTLTVAARNITEGDEIRMDYSGFRTEPTDEYLQLLQSFCDSGEGLVPVEYEGEEITDNQEL